MRRLSRIVICSFLVFLSAAGSQEQPDQKTVVVPKLKLGDIAPPLQIADYVKGGEVDFDQGRGKNIYVIEFWAMSSQSGLEIVPHLSRLQKEYRDDGVVIVGITTEVKADVETFVEKMGNKMDYVVATDDDSYTTLHYMGGFGRTEIPHAFVIDRHGRFTWEGHPMLVEEGIELVLAEEPAENER